MMRRDAAAISAAMPVFGHRMMAWVREQSAGCHAVDRLLRGHSSHSILAERDGRARRLFVW